MCFNKEVHIYNMKKRLFDQIVLKNKQLTRKYVSHREKNPGAFFARRPNHPRRSSGTCPLCGMECWLTEFGSVVGGAVLDREALFAILAGGQCWICRVFISVPFVVAFVMVSGVLRLWAVFKKFRFLCRRQRRFHGVCSLGVALSWLWVA